MIPVFAYNPTLDYAFHDEEWNARLSEFSPVDEVDVRVFPIKRRVYDAWPLRKRGAERALIDAFLRDLASPFAFYVKDPRDNARLGVALGLTTNAVLTYSLPTALTAEAYRDFAKSGTVVAYLDGLAAGLASTDTDARTVTLAANPGAGKALTLDYTAYRLCRAVAPPTWSGIDANFFQCQLSIREILRV